MDPPRELAGWDAGTGSLLTLSLSLSLTSPPMWTRSRVASVDATTTAASTAAPSLITSGDVRVRLAASRNSEKDPRMSPVAVRRQAQRRANSKTTSVAGSPTASLSRGSVAPRLEEEDQEEESSDDK